MRFFYAKHDLSCKFCRGEIQRGTFCTRSYHKNRETGDSYGFCYHIECYLEDFRQRFIRSCLYWKQQQNPRKKIGRPMIVCSDRPERRRLLSLRTYHKHLGNTVRVEEIQKEIDELEKRNE